MLSAPLYCTLQQPKAISPMVNGHFTPHTLQRSLSAALNQTHSPGFSRPSSSSFMSGSHLTQDTCTFFPFKYDETASASQNSMTTTQKQMFSLSQSYPDTSPVCVWNISEWMELYQTGTKHNSSRWGCAGTCSSPSPAPLKPRQTLLPGSKPHEHTPPQI